MLAVAQNIIAQTHAYFQDLNSHIFSEVSSPRPEGGKVGLQSELGGRLHDELEA